MNTRKPTKADVPDHALCWLWLPHEFAWVQFYGDDARAAWQRGYAWKHIADIRYPSRKDTKQAKNLPK